MSQRQRPDARDVHAVAERELRSLLKRQDQARPSEFSSTEEIIEEFRNGRMVVIIDAEDRENEGDLVIPAQMATPQAINFMATHGRGLVCLTLTHERAQALRLDPMVRANGSRNGTAFTQSIEAREGIDTGISARDRARTIATAINPSSEAGDLVSPGHVFPLIARDGGVLVRAGHTEASVDLARLAGLMPAAVICEIMKDDGTMARVPDLIAFAQVHGLKIGTIADLIAFRLRHDRVIRRVAEAPIETGHGGAFDLKVYATTVDAQEHLALVKGDVRGHDPVLVRVHCLNPLQDLIGAGMDAGADPAVATAMAAIAREGRGVLVLIRDGGAGSLQAVLAALGATGTGEADPDSARRMETGIGSQILRDLGVRDMILLTSSPQQTYAGLDGFGLSIVGVRPLAATARRQNRKPL